MAKCFRFVVYMEWQKTNEVAEVRFSLLRGQWMGPMWGVGWRLCLGARPYVGFDMEGGVAIVGNDDLQMLHRWGLQIGDMQD